MAGMEKLTEGGEVMVEQELLVSLGVCHSPCRWVLCCPLHLGIRRLNQVWHLLQNFDHEDGDEAHTTSQLCPPHRVTEAAA